MLKNTGLFSLARLAYERADSLYLTLHDYPSFAMKQIKDLGLSEKFEQLVEKCRQEYFKEHTIAIEELPDYVRLMHNTTHLYFADGYPVLPCYQVFGTKVVTVDEKFYIYEKMLLPSVESRLLELGYKHIRHDDKESYEVYFKGNPETLDETNVS